MKKINFIPEEYVRSRARRRLAADVAVPLVAVAIVAGWWLGPARAAEQDLDERRATLDRAIESVIEQRDETVEIVVDVETAPDRLELAERLTARVPVTSMIAALTESMPDPMGLSSFSLTVAPASPFAGGMDGLPMLIADDDADPDTTPPVRLDLEGLAPDDLTIARFIGRLDQQPLFARVQLGYSRPVESESLIAREFRITVEIPLDRTYVRGNEKAQVRHAD